MPPMRSCPAAPAAASSSIPMLLATAVLLTACGGGGGADAGPSEADRLAACDAARPAPEALAVAEFIKDLDPRPLRFLTAAASDSALPEDALKVVQDKGPTFYWLDGAKQQQQILDKLAGDGDWATLLVLFRGEQRDGMNTAITLGGRYVSGQHDGKIVPERVFRLQCTVDSTTSWSIVPDAPSA